MNFLAFDTSSEAQVLGLQCGESVIERTTLVGRAHSQLILPAIESLLQDAGIRLADLDGIFFGQGPGSFTGLRIAVGVVQGLAYGLNIPVVPVGTMAILAQGAHRLHGAEQVVVALHAREREVYFGSYQFVQGIAQPVGRECVVVAEAAPAQPFDECVGVGDGWSLLSDALASACQTRVTETYVDVFPLAADLLKLGDAAWQRGESISAMQAEPRYLRESVATPKASL